MLSYRHAFHAGNHADILKHLTLFLVLQYFKQKDKAFRYIDTHSGAGLYRLDEAPAQKTGEYRDGIARLYGQPRLPENLDRFLNHLARHLPEPDSYCGSPWLARSLLRPQDRLHLFELHPADCQTLHQNLDGDPRCIIKQTDGYQGLKALLPPPERRGVILIDPPYENKRDYTQVIDSLRDALRRFAGGCYLLWYPCLNREESLHLPERLAKAFPAKHLRAELHVRRPAADGFGMHGSGMWLINPPYLLHSQLNDTLPALARLLARDSGAHYLLRQQD